jgi:hypothetical protein
MNYKKIHNKIISKAKSREKKIGCFDSSVFQAHHIKPKSITGDAKWSGEKVHLTPKEHYVIHQLLLKIHKKTPKLGVCIAPNGSSP